MVNSKSSFEKLTVNWNTGLKSGFKPCWITYLFWAPVWPYVKGLVYLSNITGIDFLSISIVEMEEEHVIMSASFRLFI